MHPTNCSATGLWVHSGISLHAGKTKVWNRSGVPCVCNVAAHRSQSRTRTPNTRCCWIGLPPWLLLSFCAAARSNFFLRTVSPQFLKELAQAHDEGVWQCLSRILSVHADCGAQEQSSLPLWEGGIGLRSAHRTAPAAHWASWADALKMIRDRHPCSGGYHP